MNEDTLSEVLRAVRLNGAVFYLVEGSNPWVAEAPPASTIAPYIMPGVGHVLEFHVVSDGACYGGLLDEPARRFEAGDVVLFPHGDAHVMASGPGLRMPPDLSLHCTARAQSLPISVDLEGGGPDRARLVCGFLGCDARPFNPLLASLPRVLHMRGHGKTGSVLSSFVELALQESSSRRAGHHAMLSRLSELMFVEVLRSHLASLPPDQTGWLNGLRDETVGRALAELHARTAHPWTLEELAKDVGVSRSILSERFAHFVGMPPMQYLAQWRMQLASGMLTSSHAGIAQIADAVGYGSEAALSRAFKRLVGMSPAAFRQSRTHPETAV